LRTLVVEHLVTELREYVKIALYISIISGLLYSAVLCPDKSVKNFFQQDAKLSRWAADYSKWLKSRGGIYSIIWHINADILIDFFPVFIFPCEQIPIAKTLRGRNVQEK
jgi:hypothetical protein